MSQAIREAIERTSSAILADPAKAQAKRAPATARLVEGLQCEITGPYGETLRTDMPPAIGGSAKGPSPGWLMRGALAACTATVIGMRAAKLGIALRSVEVTVDSESDHRGMLGLDDKVSAGMRAMRLHVRIAGDADEKTLRELVAWADAHSPVGCTLSGGVPCWLVVEFG
jgi:uncharacterized OsmC-like protein